VRCNAGGIFSSSVCIGGSRAVPEYSIPELYIKTKITISFPNQEILLVYPISKLYKNKNQTFVTLSNRKTHRSYPNHLQKRSINNAYLKFLTNIKTNDWSCVGGNDSRLETVKENGNILRFRGIISAIHCKFRDNFKNLKILEVGKETLEVGKETLKGAGSSSLSVFLVPWATSQNFFGSIIAVPQDLNLQKKK